MRTIVLKPGCAKPLWRGHPWVFAESVARVDEGTPGALDWVRVVDAEGRPVGRGFYAPGSAIRVRLLERGEEGDGPERILERRIDAAAALRRRLFPNPGHTNAYRLVHGDGDGLPGLVVDRFADVLAAQFATAATHARRKALAARLLAASGARGLIARPGGFEAAEGIAPESEPFSAGEGVGERVPILEAGLETWALPLRGQKTGHYTDQRENRLHVAEIAGGLDVLDLYCGTGGFSLQALRAGARLALAVDTSELALEVLSAAAGAQALDERLEARRADAAHALGALRTERRRFGVVVADPPNFVPRRGPARGALKAYRELNARALSRVEAGGFMATFSCTAKLGAADLLELLRSASRECRRPFSVLRELTAGPDHPVAAGLAEGRYLSGLLVRVSG